MSSIRQHLLYPHVSLYTTLHQVLHSRSTRHRIYSMHFHPPLHCYLMVCCSFTRLDAPLLMQPAASHAAGLCNPDDAYVDCIVICVRCVLCVLFCRFTVNMSYCCCLTLHVSESPHAFTFLHLINQTCIYSARYDK